MQSIHSNAKPRGNNLSMYKTNNWKTVPCQITHKKNKLIQYIQIGWYLVQVQHDLVCMKLAKLFEPIQKVFGDMPYWI